MKGALRGQHGGYGCHCKQLPAPLRAGPSKRSLIQPTRVIEKNKIKNLHYHSLTWQHLTHLSVTCNHHLQGTLLLHLIIFFSFFPCGRVKIIKCATILVSLASSIDPHASFSTLSFSELVAFIFFPFEQLMWKFTYYVCFIRKKKPFLRNENIFTFTPFSGCLLLHQRKIKTKKIKAGNFGTHHGSGEHENKKPK